MDSTATGSTDVMIISGVSILMSYGENPHYVKLKSALRGPKPISRTGGSLLKN